MTEPVQHLRQGSRPPEPNSDEWTPITHKNCKDLRGPFYHGTKASLVVGDLLLPGQPSNYEEGRVSNHIYFAADLEPAIWGAELAVSMSAREGCGHIYIVEPTGPFDDDPNLTNKRFLGNPTQSYRTREPMKIVGVVANWSGHSAEVRQGMLDALDSLKRRGLCIIEDQVRDQPDARRIEAEGHAVESIAPRSSSV
jgi:rifampin ADP-ribosylating transferase